MLKKVGIILLAILFVGSVSLMPTVNKVNAAAKCACGKDCKCEHCATGKGGCNCQAGDKGCQCGKGCQCEHCMTGKGACACRGDATGCACGKGCKCEHCATGKGACVCKAGKTKGKRGGRGCNNCMTDSKGCQCGKGCKCEHCTSGRGECRCQAGPRGCNCKCEHCAKGAANAPEAVKPASDADYSKTMKSKDGGFKATYMSDPEAIPVNKLHAWKLKVETADGQAVKDAEIIVTGDMPEHGHGMPTQPKVTKNFGDGTYLIEGMKFSMTGWWTMTFTIKAAGKTDTVTFNLQLK